MMQYEYTMLGVTDKFEMAGEMMEHLITANGKSKRIYTKECCELSPIRILSIVGKMYE